MSSFSIRELSAPGRGAIRVLEVTGKGVLERIESMAPGLGMAPGTFRPVPLRGRGGQLLDEAIVVMHSPARLELHLHGAAATVERVVRELGVEGRLAGNRSRPLDIEQQAEELLASAPSEAAARVLLDQAQGALRRALTRLLELGEAEMARRAKDLARLGKAAWGLFVPPRVVLAGRVNAGKSTLFNALVGRERVLVDCAAGTTRDAVHERIRIGAHAIDLYDTAGERALSPAEEGAQIERAGQALARDLRRAADLTLWLYRPGEEPAQVRLPAVRFLGTRADEGDGGGVPPWPAISALEDPQRARLVVERLVTEALELSDDPWTPGAGVPFEASWIEDLESCPPAVLVERVRTWLGRGRD